MNREQVARRRTGDQPRVRLWYPACVLVPMVVAMLADPTPLHTLIALLSAVLVVYLRRIRSRVDYGETADEVGECIRLRHRNPGPRPY
jgi:hypothetical protein